MAGYVTASPAHPTRLAAAGAVQCKAGIVGASAAGVALDTEFYGVYIQLNATAATVSIAGFNDSAGNPQSILLSGQVASDVQILFPVPWLNYAGPLVFTASLANLVWVLTRPYNGPEAPNAGGFKLS